MACLFRRNNGIYYIVSSENGRQRWTSLRTRNGAHARQLFQEIEQEEYRKTRGTLSSFFDDFLKRAPLVYQKNTIIIYARSFKNFLRISGDRPVRMVTSLSIEKFKQQRAQEVSPVSVNMELRSLRAAFNEAKRLKLVTENPFQGVRQVRVPYKEASYLSESEFSRLLTFIDDPEFKNLVKFAVFTMMRRGEIINLRWANVDLSRRELQIRSDGEFQVKGGKPRIVLMNDWVFNLLASKAWKGEYVFSNRRGGKLTGDAVSHRFKCFVRKAELSDGIHFHSLRHTGISWLVNRGVPQPFVQRLAGHSSPIVTDKVYTHLEDKTLLAAVNAFPVLN